MGKTSGVYIMRVASMLTGMHPQTLRKYERAGLLEPSRNKKLRMYSDEDIIRLKTIKHFVEDLGLNLAGVKIALKVQETVIKVRKQLSSADLTANRRKQLISLLDESLHILGTVLGQDEDDQIYASGMGDNKQ